MPPVELNLIVAATRKMGIGLNGTMPWTNLRQEMQYFARVTSRVPPHASINAVIMGRKTWDSIPSKFRPLKNRLNIVVSRSATTEHQDPTDLLVRVGSLDQALDVVAAHARSVGRVFVMGGGQIYDEALRRSDAKRVLLTRIERDYECDTFFGIDLGAWRQVSTAEWRDWTGEEGEQRNEEAGVVYEWEMWERR